MLPANILVVLECSTLDYGKRTMQLKRQIIVKLPEMHKKYYSTENKIKTLAKSHSKAALYERTCIIRNINSDSTENIELSALKAQEELQQQQSSDKP